MAILGARRQALRLLQPLIVRAAGPLARFRVAKQLGDARQLRWLLQMQARRNALADVFFVASSFAGNADFYLLLLPTMIWQGAPKLARQLTYMVTSSLILGNTLKDLVALPRPPSPPVWRSASGAALDSTAFADYGWPSTHAMNAVTNPLLVIAAIRPWWRKNFRRKVFIFCASISWCVTISVGRLYLGAHSRSDVFGGHVLGALVAAFWVPMAGPFDAAVTASGAVGAWLIGVAFSLAATLFILYPSRLLAGASAPQSAELVGLFLGCMVGSRQDAARVRRAGELVPWCNEADHSKTEPTRRKRGSRPAAGARLWARAVRTPGRAAVAREVVGFVIALACRELTSTGAQAIFAAALRPRGDVAASLVVILRKATTYFVIAMTMAGWSPAAFRWLRIAY